jgi:CRP-like cAMP-binding protein
MYYGESDGIPSGIYTTGSFFGEVELLTNTDRNFTSIALAKCTILKLEKKMFHNIFFKKYPRFGKAFQEIMEIRNEGFLNIFDFVQKLILNQVGGTRNSTMKSMSYINPFMSKYSRCYSNKLKLSS